MLVTLMWYNPHPPKNMIKNSDFEMWQTVCWGHGQRCVHHPNDEVLRQSSVYLIFVLKQKLFSWQSKDDVEHKRFCIIAEMCLRAIF